MALTLVWGIVLVPVDLVGAWVMFGVTLFDALLFNLVLPRRLQVFNDRIRIVLGRPLVFNIPLSTIREVRPTSYSRAFAYRGFRFATSSRSVVEIVRSKGWNVVVSPANKEQFLGHVTQALKAIAR